MKCHLMFRDADFDPVRAGRRPPALSAGLVQDLELDILLDAMAAGDEVVRSAASAALLAPLTDPDAVRFRQDVLADCARHPDVAAELFGLAGEAIAADRSVFASVFSKRPELILHRSVQVLDLFVNIVEKLRTVTAERADEFRSEGFRAFFATVRSELDGAYMTELEGTIDTLRLKGGLVFSATLGSGGQTVAPVLRRPREVNRRRFSKITLRKPTAGFSIPDRDDVGFEALQALRDRSLADVSSAASQAVAHVLGFFVALRGEVAFYLGCLNLTAALGTVGMTMCRPEPLEPGTDTLTATGLFEPCLVLRTQERAVGNKVDATGVRLVIVTGANHGGKSTFLRSVGVAQLLMGAGANVPADAFSASLTPAVRTHWEREEDVGLEHGKLDEELARMSAIADAVEPGALVLSNESFASTNQAEGSEIGLAVFRALTGTGVRVVAVTHLYDLGHQLYESGEPEGVFLRAPRAFDGSRSYHLELGEPLPTSYARDLYDKEFGDQPRTSDLPSQTNVPRAYQSGASHTPGSV